VRSAAFGTMDGDAKIANNVTPMRAFETKCGRMLVVAAHPDDETIGCGALLGRVSDARIAYLTDGVPKDGSLRPIAFRDDAAAYRAARARELCRALELVGMDESRILFLGGVDQEASYTMLPLVDRLLGVMDEVGPSLVITHPYEGGHPDHDTAAFVTRMACTVRQKNHAHAPPIWEMTSYHARHGQLVTGSFLDDPCANEIRESFTLTLSTDERRRKELGEVRQP